MNQKHFNIRVLIQMRDLRVGNGISACIMNYYEYAVQNGILIDFLLTRDINSHYRDEVLSNNSHIYVMPYDTSKPNRNNNKYVRDVLDNNYDILHVNISGYYAVSSLKIAKQLGIKSRIYHVHNPREPLSLKCILRNILYVNKSIYLSNYLVACSESAGKSVFVNKKFNVLYNAMDIDRFKFNLNIRQKIRQEFGISNETIVVGTVGRLEQQKNPLFLIDVFYQFQKIHDNTILIWAGEGSMLDEIKKRIHDYKIDNKVFLLGTRKDVPNLYSAMDLFLLPSKFEGLGLVFIEAQASGLLCFGSDKVPVDVNITKCMNRLGLNISAQNWAKEMEKTISSYSDLNRISLNGIVKNSKFYIVNNSGDLINLYRNSLTVGE